MSEKVTNIAKNTSYFTIALIIQKIISFSYFTMYARELGPENLGKFYFAISFTSIFSVLMDIGLANVLIREVAKRKENASVLMRSIIAIKIPLAIISWLFVIGISYTLGYDDLTKTLVFISSFCILLDSFTGVFFASIRGFHNLKFESVSSIGFQLTVFILSIIVFRMDLGIAWLMGTLLTASLLNFTYSALVNVLKFKVNILPKWNKQLMHQILVLTAPFLVYNVFQKLYTFMDTILLKTLAGDAAVGLYQIPFKIVLALQFLPAAFVASIYPAMSRYWKDKSDQLTITFERSISYLTIIAVPIVVGVISLADQIIILFKSEYSYDAAILPLQLIMLALFFMFLTNPVGSLLNACNRQKQNTINMIITAVFSIGLNFLLIPRLGVVGASITITLASALLLSLGWRYVGELVNYNRLKLLKMFAKTIVSAIVMYGLIFLLKPILNIIITIPLAGLTYFAVLIALKGIKIEDIKSIVQSFKRK